jgi:hypothetical protein
MKNEWITFDKAYIFISDELRRLYPRLDPAQKRSICHELFKRLAKDASPAYSKEALRKTLRTYIVLEAAVTIGVHEEAEEMLKNASTSVPVLASQTAPQPPVNAEFLLHLLLREEEQEAFIGCLVERYGQKFERFGKRRADIWFCAEVARSIWPLTRRYVGKALKMVVIGEWIRRMIH